jgi:hypothetical protein
LVELKGSLTSIGLPAIVQLIGELHHTGTLQLARGSAHGVLAFDDGRLVTATYEHETGLAALASCARELSEGEFTFIEGPVTSERTLDLGYAELQQQLVQLTDGATPTDEPPRISPVTVVEEPATCPLLGFADDRDRHYSRPTALHRCYAGGVASLVTSPEQRELCLADRFPTCPRYRTNASAPVQSVQPVRPAPLTEPAPPPEPAEVPSGVVSRMATLDSMRLAAAPDASEQPTPSAPERPATQSTPRPKNPDLEPAPRRIRGVQLIVGGTLLGLVLLLAIVVLVIPSFNSGLIPRPGSDAQSNQAVQGVGTPSARPATAQALAPRTQGSPVAAVVPTARAVGAAPSAVASPIAVAGARASSESGAVRSLLDLRLADGAARGWRENPPYVGWSDGAYRLQARQITKFVAVGIPLAEPLGDGVVAATLRKTGGPPGGGYGLIIRDQGPDPRDGISQNMTAYVFEAGDLGEYGVWRRDGDHWIDLVPWMRSSAVHMGGSPNDLAVRATGDTFVFTVNGVDVATVQDDALMAGGIGLFVGGDNNEVAVDRFLVQVPQ